MLQVGGLADVVPAIAKAHQARGQLAEIILPKYDTLDYSQVSDLREITEFQCPWGRASIKVKVRATCGGSMCCCKFMPRAVVGLWQQRFDACSGCLHESLVMVRPLPHTTHEDVL